MAGIYCQDIICFNEIQGDENISSNYIQLLAAIANGGNAINIWNVNTEASLIQSINCPGVSSIQWSKQGLHFVVIVKEQAIVYSKKRNLKSTWQWEESNRIYLQQTAEELINLSFSAPILFVASIDHSIFYHTEADSFYPLTKNSYHNNDTKAALSTDSHYCIIWTELSCPNTEDNHSFDILNLSDFISSASNVNNLQSISVHLKENETIGNCYWKHKSRPKDTEILAIITRNNTLKVYEVFERRDIAEDTLVAIALNAAMVARAAGTENAVASGDSNRLSKSNQRHGLAFNLEIVQLFEINNSSLFEGLDYKENQSVANVLLKFHWPSSETLIKTNLPQAKQMQQQPLLSKFTTISPIKAKQSSQKTASSKCSPSGVWMAFLVGDSGHGNNMKLYLLNLSYDVNQSTYILDFNSRIELNYNISDMDESCDSIVWRSSCLFMHLTLSRDSLTPVSIKLCSLLTSNSLTLINTSSFLCKEQINTTRTILNEVVSRSYKVVDSVRIKDNMRSWDIEPLGENVGLFSIANRGNLGGKLTLPILLFSSELSTPFYKLYQESLTREMSCVVHDSFNQLRNISILLAVSESLEEAQIAIFMNPRIHDILNSSRQRSNTKLSQQSQDNNDEETNIVEYFVDIIPDTHFGIGLSLDEERDTGSNSVKVVVSNFKKHPITKESMAAEACGRIRLGDELAGVNTETFKNQPLSKVISTIKGILHKHSQGTAIKLRFRRGGYSSNTLIQNEAKEEKEDDNDDNDNHSRWIAVSGWKNICETTFNCRSKSQIVQDALIIPIDSCQGEDFRFALILLFKESSTLDQGIVHSLILKVFVCSLPSFSLYDGSSSIGPMDCAEISAISQRWSPHVENQISYSLVSTQRMASNKLDSFCASRFSIQNSQTAKLEKIFELSRKGAGKKGFHLHEISSSDSFQDIRKDLTVRRTCIVKCLESLAMIRANTMLKSSGSGSSSDQYGSYSHPKAAVDQVGSSGFDMQVNLLDIANVAFLESFGQSLCQFLEMLKTIHSCTIDFDAAKQCESMNSTCSAVEAFHFLMKKNYLSESDSFLESRALYIMNKRAVQFTLSYVYHDKGLDKPNQPEEEEVIVFGDKQLTPLALFFSHWFTRGYFLLFSLLSRCKRNTIQSLLEKSSFRGFEELSNDRKGGVDALVSLVESVASILTLDCFALRIVLSGLLDKSLYCILTRAGLELERLKPDIFTRGRRKIAISNAAEGEDGGRILRGGYGSGMGEATSEKSSALRFNLASNTLDIDDMKLHPISTLQVVNALFSSSQSQLFHMLLDCFNPLSQESGHTDQIVLQSLGKYINFFSVTSDNEKLKNVPIEDLQIVGLDMLSFLGNAMKASLWLHDFEPVMQLVLRNALRQFKASKSSMEIFLEMVMIGKVDMLLQLAKADKSPSGQQLFKLLSMVEETLNPPKTDKYRDRDDGDEEEEDDDEEEEEEDDEDEVERARVVDLIAKLRKNAFALVRKQRYRQAAAVFLLCPTLPMVRSAQSILLQQNNQPLLAHFVMRCTEQRIFNHIPSPQQTSKLEDSLMQGTASDPATVENLSSRSGYVLGAYSVSIMEREILPGLIESVEGKESASGEDEQGVGYLGVRDLQAIVLALSSAVLTQDNELIKQTFDRLFPFLEQITATFDSFSLLGEPQRELKRALEDAFASELSKSDFSTIFQYLASLFGDIKPIAGFMNLLSCLEFLAEMSCFAGVVCAGKMQRLIQSLCVHCGLHELGLRISIAQSDGRFAVNSSAEGLLIEEIIKNNAFSVFAERYRPVNATRIRTLQTTRSDRLAENKQKRVDAASKAMKTAKLSSETNEITTVETKKLSFNFASMSRPKTGSSAAASAVPSSASAGSAYLDEDPGRSALDSFNFSSVRRPTSSASSAPRSALDDFDNPSSISIAPKPRKPAPSFDPSMSATKSALDGW